MPNKVSIPFPNHLSDEERFDYDLFMTLYCLELLPKRM